FLPSIENSTKPTTSVAAAASSGETQPMSREGSERASNLIRIDDACRRSVCAFHALCADERARHQQAERLGIGLPSGIRGGKPSACDEAEQIADIEQTV